jgi:uncharacterized membrane protein YkoI
VLALLIAPLVGSGQENVSKAPRIAKASVDSSPAKPPAEPNIASSTPGSSTPASNVSATTGSVSEWIAVRRSLAKTKISLAAAVKIAQEKIDSSKNDTGKDDSDKKVAGRVVEAYFKVEDARPLYVVEIIPASGDHQEVVIDALSGKIMELGAPDPEDKAEIEIEIALAKLKVAIPEAIETASLKMPHARPFDAYAVRQDDAIVLTIELLDGADVRSVRIDPTSGEVLSVGPQKE